MHSRADTHPHPCLSLRESGLQPAFAVFDVVSTAEPAGRKVLYPRADYRLEILGWVEFLMCILHGAFDRCKDPCQDLLRHTIR